MNVYRLIANDGDEGYAELGLYSSRDDAEADRLALEARYPGRPYWIDFAIDKIAVLARRATDRELLDGLVYFADTSLIESTWGDAKAPDSYLSEHGKARSVR